MADFKCHMARHLRSAKDWLTRAEESFDKDSNIRGELDLFLAQAELKHARESNSTRQWRYKYPFIRHALSLVLATAIVAIGFGAYWWSNERSLVVPIPTTAQEPRPMPTAKVGGETVSIQAHAAEPSQVAGPITASATTPSPSAVLPAERAEKIERSSQSNKENLLPPDEMQKVIRAAGKSLRGQ